MDAALLTRQQRLAQTFALRQARTRCGQVSYRERGAGAQTLVLLHGIGSVSASWFDVAERLQEVRIVAWDAPGYGASTPLPMQQPSARDYAQVLGEFLDAIAVQQCILVGHSLGALMAAAFVAGTQTKHSVETMVLISPAKGYGADPLAAERTRGERLATLEQLGVEGMARERSARLLSGQADADARAWVRWNMGQLQEQGYRAAVHMLCGDDIARYTPATVSTQVWCGQEDQITPVAACAAVAHGFGTDLQIIGGAGHASPVEAPHAVSGLLRKVLQGHGTEVVQ
jgi:pimeloyl-ACP methyl ester carboxylesterase